MLILPESDFEGGKGTYIAEGVAMAIIDHFLKYTSFPTVEKVYDKHPSVKFEGQENQKDD
jgi:hypothetical protein